MRNTTIIERERKVCPLRMLAMETSAANTRLRHMMACIQQQCEWWDGNACVIRNIGISLAGIDLSTEASKQ